MENTKTTKKKVIAMLLAILMVASALPLMAFVSEAEGEGYVYLSISYDKNYIEDKNGSPIVYVPVALEDIAAVDLNSYGLDNMLYDADGDGEYEITALQLLIYAHEQLYGGDWSEVTFDALPGSSYFAGGIFGFTENLVYFLNGDFPVDESQTSDFMTVGATSDRIVLQAGDFLDVASFGCYSFLWDQLGGFHLFADEDGYYVHDYTAKAGSALTVKLKHSFCDLMFGISWVKDATDFEIFYGSAYGEAIGSVTTDENGNAEIIFPSAGTYYVWSEGGIGSDDGTHGSCDHYMQAFEPCVVSSPAYAMVTVTEDTSSAIPDPTPDKPRQPQDVSNVLNETMAQLADTVSAPDFGTNAGEWTVFSLARGGYFEKDDTYFTDYYNRIVAAVNEKAQEVNKDGALDKNKSTENSRLIVALSAIGKDARAVGNWNLVEAYSANGLNWIKKQGMNGTIWTLIALDSGNYETSDPTIRQQCVDSILEARHNDGAWSLVTAKEQPSNVDITCMTLTALYPYRNQPEVAEACAEAIEWLSESQLASGGFPYGQGETSESCAWAIVALCTWGINPDTDARFIKDGKSAIDNLLTYYIADESMFEHGKGAGSNAMATDQATYALVAYERFINGENALYDYSDVTFEVTPPNTDTPATPPVTSDFKGLLLIPAAVDHVPGTTFNGAIRIDGWNNTAGYKLIDVVVTVPEGLVVQEVTSSDRLKGGKIQYHYSEESCKLRIVYFDAVQNRTLSVTGTTFPVNLFTVTFRVKHAAIESSLYIGITDMTLKTSSAENSATVVNTTNAFDSVRIVEGMTFSAAEIYRGDGTEIIPSTKKAIAIAVTAMYPEANEIIYKDASSEIIFKYSKEITKESGVASYVALVDTSIPQAEFEKNENYTVTANTSSDITYGDVNGDGIINAQDALATVNAWLRRGETLTQPQMMAANVNGDAHIVTYDALGIVESFVYNNHKHAVITKAYQIFDN